MGKDVILEACPAKGSRQARESFFKPSTVLDNKKDASSMT